MLDDEIQALVDERQAARKAKNFARSDEIRNLLAEKGIILEDTKDGMRWKRK
jgi:cysteinyl-tRNA synthetase